VVVAIEAGVAAVVVVVVVVVGEDEVAGANDGYELTV
jgi:hypothetical protein